MSYYSGKCVYISGGSSGIGLALAKSLVLAGAKVAISARGEARLREAEDMLQGMSGKDQVLALVADVSDMAQCEEAAKKVIEAFGQIDVVIANAGIAHCMTIQDTEAEVFEKMMRVNYLGTVYTIKAFLPYLRERKGGHIGIVSSILGFLGTYGYTAYAPSKFAQVGFAESLRQELLSDDISVSVLYPPDTDTPQLAAENKTKPPETAAISGNVKVMTPEAVAEVFLKGMAKKKQHLVPGGMGKLTRFMKRHAPWVVNWVMERDLKSLRR